MSTLQSLGEILGLLLVFLLVMLLTWLTTRWISKHTAIASRSGNIKVLETYKLAPDRYLQIVKVVERYLVLAVTKDRVSVLVELQKEEVPLESRGESSMGDSSQGASFQEILKKLSSGKGLSGKGFLGKNHSSELEFPAGEDEKNEKNKRTK